MMTRAGSERPRLLVSVRDADEAVAAIAGGANIIDVKDPSAGSLGRASAEAWQQIAAVIPANVPLSLALGELVEWSPEACVPAIPPTTRWLKLGLAGAQTLPDWRSAWMSLRTRVTEACPNGVGWVAVAYADAAEAGAPDLESVAATAVESGCQGFLMDTWSKRSASLVDLPASRRVPELLKQLRASGLFTAVAGSLRPADLSAVAGWGADIVAVRTAACEGAVRNGRVSADCVAHLIQSLAGSGLAEIRSGGAGCLVSQPVAGVGGRALDLSDRTA